MGADAPHATWGAGKNVSPTANERPRRTPQSRRPPKEGSDGVPADRVSRPRGHDRAASASGLAGPKEQPDGGSRRRALRPVIRGCSSLVEPLTAPERRVLLALATATGLVQRALVRVLPVLGRLVDHDDDLAEGMTLTDVGERVGYLVESVRAVDVDGDVPSDAGRRGPRNGRGLPARRARPSGGWSVGRRSSQRSSPATALVRALRRSDNGHRGRVHGGRRTPTGVRPDRGSSRREARAG